MRSNVVIPKLLVALSALLLSFTVNGQAENGQATPSDIEEETTFVIVHGAWGGSWAFREVDSLLSNKGYSVYRPSLTGQGERVHLANPDIDLNTHIEDVVNVLLYEELNNVVLVGHSYGGMVITGVADRVPDRIRRMVYIDAFLPNDKESVASLAASPGSSMIDRVQGGMIVPSWIKPEQAPPKDVPQSVKTFTQPIALTNLARQQIAGTYILTVAKGKGSKTDTFAAFSERAKQRGWPVLQLEADHNPQWSAPGALVKMLIKIAEDA